MPKEYIPKEVEVVGDADQYGNLPYTVLFEDGSRAFMKAQKPPVKGQAEFGEIQDTPKRSGEGTYKKFKRMQREQHTPNTQSNTTTSNDKTDKSGDGMAWGNALTNAVLVKKHGLVVEEVLEVAQELFSGRPGADPAQSVKEIFPGAEEDDDIDLNETPF